MTLRIVAVILLLLCAASARAHHIWILPDAGGGSAHAVFGDTLAPGSPEVLTNIAHTRLWQRRGDLEAPLIWKREPKLFTILLAQPGPLVIGGECRYGTEVHDHRLRQDVQPYLLVYYPKAIVGPTIDERPWPKLSLEIVPKRTGDRLRLQVLFQGQPVSKAEMFAFCPDGERINQLADEQGCAEIPLKSGGHYGFRTRVLRDVEGTHEGKAYWQVRHYASLVIHVPTPSPTE